MDSIHLVTSSFSLLFLSLLKSFSMCPIVWPLVWHFQNQWMPSTVCWIFNALSEDGSEETISTLNKMDYQSTGRTAAIIIPKCSHFTHSSLRLFKYANISFFVLIVFDTITPCMIMSLYTNTWNKQNHSDQYSVTKALIKWVTSCNDLHFTYLTNMYTMFIKRMKAANDVLSLCTKSSILSCCNSVQSSTFSTK